MKFCCAICFAWISSQLPEQKEGLFVVGWWVGKWVGVGVKSGYQFKALKLSLTRLISIESQPKKIVVVVIIGVVVVVIQVVVVVIPVVDPRNISLMFG